MRSMPSVEPIGYRADGTPFWIYFGSEPNDDGGDGGGAEGAGGDEGDDSDDGDDEDDDKVGDDGLTGRGRKAIQAERSAAERARKAYKPWGALRRELGMTPDEIRAAVKATKSSTKSSKDDGDDGDRPDPTEIRREAEVAAMGKVNDKLVKAAVRAEAAAVLKHPGDAVKFLDLSDYEVGDDGEVDPAVIKRDLRALLADRPELGLTAKRGGPGGGHADFEGGPRGNAPGGKSMSEIIRDAAARRR
jgi:hypothetical protein